MIELKHYLIECMRVGLVVLWAECDIWPKKKTHRRSIPERGHWTDRHDTIWVYLTIGLEGFLMFSQHFQSNPYYQHVYVCCWSSGTFFDGDATHPLRYAATAFFTLPTAIVGFPSRKPPISCGDFHICGFFTYVPMISTSTQEELMRWAQHAMISTTIIFDHFWGAHSNVISLKYGELMANYSNLTGTDNCSIGLWQHVEAVPACVGNYNTLSMIHMYIYILYGGFLK